GPEHGERDLERPGGHEAPVGEEPVEPDRDRVADDDRERRCQDDVEPREGAVGELVGGERQRREGREGDDGGGEVAVGGGGRGGGRAARPGSPASRPRRPSTSRTGAGISSRAATPRRATLGDGRPDPGSRPRAYASSALRRASFSRTVSASPAWNSSMRARSLS